MLVSFLLALLFALLNYLYITTLDASAFADCSPRDPGVLMGCVTYVLYSHLADPLWVGMQLSMYVPIAGVVAYLLLRNVPVPVLANGIAMAGGAMASLLLFVDPGLLVALSAMCGVMLASLFVHWRRREKVRINPNAIIKNEAIKQ